MKTIVSDNIKSFREAWNYTQSKVAAFLGIDRGAYANYESGNREMPYELMTKICELYGIDLSVLFEEDSSILEDELVCAFRLENPCDEDIKEISHFKQVVRNYLKMYSY
ncbi:MAG: family transcriptional regulator [Bacteroidetes bacterium]|jgi:transcriptional regulator with XRE-family HTH domain|nr:family transcriptional regulator [Bacteroidota bacterium]